MGRRRKASLWAGTGHRVDRGRKLPGYYVRYYDYTPAGRRINRSKRFLALADARRWVRERNALLDLGEIGWVSRVDLRTAVTEFVAGLSALAPDTQGNYASALGWLSGLVGSKAVCDINGADIDAFVSSRLSKTGAATTAKHVRGLHRFFAWAVDRGYATGNPIKAATSLPRGKHVRAKPHLTDVDLARLVSHLDTEDRRIAVWLAMTTGLDRGVVDRLCTRHVDLDGHCIRVTRPKTRKQLAVPIHITLLPLIAQRLDRSDPSRPLLAGLTRQAKHRDWWARATVAAGLEGMLFRDLRAVASTRIQRDGGASLPDAQHLLGHASAQTTADHYHVPDPATVARLDALPLPGLPPSEAR